MSDIGITLHKEFADQLRAFAKILEGWKQSEEKLFKAHQKIGQELLSEAKERVPVDIGNLKQRLLTNTYKEGRGIITETGTNVAEYPVFLEFGTEHIAGGRVLALGQDANITDAEAVKTWPAKIADLVDDRTGKSNARVVSAIHRRISAGGAQEQMPWLRPAFQSIKTWAIEQIDASWIPPKGRFGKTG